MDSVGLPLKLTEAQMQSYFRLNARVLSAEKLLRYVAFFIRKSILFLLPWKF